MQTSFVLGTAQLGGAYGINNKVGIMGEEQVDSVLMTAVECGVTLLDTAEGYGSSEMLIGKFYEANPGCKLQVCTKLTTSLQKEEEPILAQIKERIERSSAFLGGCPIEIYYLHSFEMCADEGIMASMEELKNRGFFNSVGVSIYEPAELEYILSNRANMIDVVQIPFNALNSSQWIDSGVLNKAQQNNILLLARSIYVQGLIFKDPEDAFVKSLGLSNALRVFHEGAEKAGVGYAQYACDYVRGTKEISSIILGCETSEQVKENAAVFSSPNSWTNAQRDNQLNLSREIDQHSLDPRFWT